MLLFYFIMPTHFSRVLNFKLNHPLKSNIKNFHQPFVGALIRNQGALCKFTGSTEYPENVKALIMFIISY